ncbi:MAG: hotdog fold thioesterase [Balneolaceae bacterium]|nr:MAG: hotdog fold thioesterase [Balneolaceae bacterium]
MIIDEDLRIRFEKILSLRDKTMGDAMGMMYEKISKDELIATMPVNENTSQPMGILHGGASVALAETLSSVGAWLNVDEEKQIAVGLEINANHIRPVPMGQTVTGIAKPLHRGAQTHVWETRIMNQADKLVCISRCTIAILKKR